MLVERLEEKISKRSLVESSERRNNYVAIFADDSSLTSSNYMLSNSGSPNTPVLANSFNYIRTLNQKLVCESLFVIYHTNHHKANIVGIWVIIFRLGSNSYLKHFKVSIVDGFECIPILKCLGLLFLGLFFLNLQSSLFIFPFVILINETIWTIVHTFQNLIQSLFDFYFSFWSEILFENILYMIQYLIENIVLK